MTFDFSKMKRLDLRPAIGWWSPGGGEYTVTCNQCKCMFVGDKRAGHCADCAYENHEKKLKELIVDVYRIGFGKASYYDIDHNKMIETITNIDIAVGEVYTISKHTIPKAEYEKMGEFDGF